MTATQLASILHTLDCWAMKDQFCTQHVYDNTTAKKEFSSIFEDKKVEEGYYLWIWAESIQEYNEVSKLLVNTFGIDFHPFLFAVKSEVFHFILKIED